MPIQFQSIPASQLKQSQPQKRGRPAGTGVTTKKSTDGRRTIVTLPAHGAKLFEPIVRREKPIIVEFTEYFSTDNVRFSKDGFFGIKYFQPQRRCTLLYFRNPVNVTRATTIESACQEAIDYEVHEFVDSDAFRDASMTINHELVMKLRHESALGQVELKIIDILREQIVAEKFLKTQRLIDQQDKQWQTELERIRREEEKEEKEKENEKLEQEGIGASELTRSEPTTEASKSEEKAPVPVPKEKRQETKIAELPRTTPTKGKPLPWGRKSS